MSGYWSKSWCSKGAGSPWVQISGGSGGRPPMTVGNKKTRFPGLLRDVDCVNLRLAVLILYRRVTDRQTDTRRGWYPRLASAARIKMVKAMATSLQVYSRHSNKQQVTFSIPRSFDPFCFSSDNWTTSVDPEPNSKTALLRRAVYFHALGACSSLVASVSGRTPVGRMIAFGSARCGEYHGNDMATFLRHINHVTNVRETQLPRPPPPLPDCRQYALQINRNNCTLISKSLRLTKR